MKCAIAMKGGGARFKIKNTKKTGHGNRGLFHVG